MSVEKVLMKMAGQLREFDEASLMSLWEKYAQQVTNFEPSKRWEESVLIFGMIQAMRFKNQLFNHHWADGSEPGSGNGRPIPPPFPHLAPEGDRKNEGGRKRGKVLEFKPKEEGE